MSESANAGTLIARAIPTLAETLRSLSTAADKPLGAAGKALAAERDRVLGYIDTSLSEGERAWQQIFGTSTEAQDKRALESQAQLDELAQALDFGISTFGLTTDVFERLAGLLIDPPRVPGDPCLAPTPLLRDLLDLALGRGGGAAGAILGGVRNTVEDLLLPASGTAEVLERSVQSVLEDPITAALNMILGQRGKIDCVTSGGLGVADDVIGTTIRRLEDALAGALP